MKINELPREGKVTLPVLITRADVNRTNKNTPYLALTLEDNTGDLDAKFWNLTDEQAASWKVGMVVEATGDILIYRNALQLRVRSLKELPDEHVSDYVRSAPCTRVQMEEEIEDIVSHMDNEIIRNLTDALLKDNHEKFFTYPAAVKNHHNYPGGLAYHSLSMLRTAMFITDLYPFLNKDLLYAGILLHDMGKIVELSSPVLAEYTPTGNLIGHISLMAQLLDREAVRQQVEDSEEVMLLKHLILSHHGKQEFGSPVLPMIPEAEVLTMLDNLDARMYMMKEALTATMPGTMSPRVFALDNRMLYRTKNENLQHLEPYQEESLEKK